jgi:hypothetical protein
MKGVAVAQRRARSDRREQRAESKQPSRPSRTSSKLLAAAVAIIAAGAIGAAVVLTQSGDSRGNVATQLTPAQRGVAERELNAAEAAWLASRSVDMLRHAQRALAVIRSHGLALALAEIHLAGIVTGGCSFGSAGYHLSEARRALDRTTRLPTSSGRETRVS